MLSYKTAGLLMFKPTVVAYLVVVFSLCSPLFTQGLNTKTERSPLGFVSVILQPVFTCDLSAPRGPA